MTIAIPAGSPGIFPIGVLRGANMASTGDQPIILQLPPGVSWRLLGVLAAGLYGSVGAAAGGIYTGVGKTGRVLIPATMSYGALTVGGLLNLTVSDTGVYGPDVTTVYLSLTTAALGVCACDLYVYAFMLPQAGAFGYL